MSERTCIAVIEVFSELPVAIAPSEQYAARLIRSPQFAAIGTRAGYAWTYARRSRRETVGHIRRQVFERDKRQCVACGEMLVLDSGHRNSMEMHERIPRGRGGVIALWNSESRCHDCHTGRHGAHGKRRPRFGEGRRA